MRKLRGSASQLVSAHKWIASSHRLSTRIQPPSRSFCIRSRSKANCQSRATTQVVSRGSVAYMEVRITSDFFAPLLISGYSNCSALLRRRPTSRSPHIGALHKMKHLPCYLCKPIKRRHRHRCKHMLRRRLISRSLQVRRALLV